MLSPPEGFTLTQPQPHPPPACLSRPASVPRPSGLRGGAHEHIPSPRGHRGQESRGPCSGTLVDAQFQQPSSALPMLPRACEARPRKPAGPSTGGGGLPLPPDPGCSPLSAPAPDLSPDESPISVYSRDLPGNEDVHLSPASFPWSKAPLWLLRAQAPAPQTAFVALRIPALGFLSIRSRPGLQL